MKTSFVGPLPREGCVKLDHSIMLYFLMIALLSLTVFGGIKLI
jgi:hypothetical protein